MVSRYRSGISMKLAKMLARMGEKVVSGLARCAVLKKRCGMS